MEGAFALGLRGGANKALSSDGSLTDKDSSSALAGEGFGVVGGVKRPPEMLVASGLDKEGASLEHGLSSVSLGGIKRLGGNFVFPDLENEESLATGGGPEGLGGENKPESWLLDTVLGGSVDLPGAENSPAKDLLEEGRFGNVDTDELVLGGWKIPAREEPGPTDETPWLLGGAEEASRGGANNPDAEEESGWGAIF